MEAKGFEIGKRKLDLKPYKYTINIHIYIYIYVSHINLFYLIIGLWFCYGGRVRLLFQYEGPRTDDEVCCTDGKALS